MDDYGVVYHFKVNATVVGSEPVKRFAIAVDLSKAVIVEIGKIRLGHFECVEEFELLECVHPRNFGGADFVKDNL